MHGCNKYMANKIRVGFLIAGFKGINFLKDIENECSVVFVSSYPVKGTLDNAYKNIKKICREKKYKFIDRPLLVAGIPKNTDLIFIVGWQFLLGHPDKKLMVFHDSLLPKLRGWSPTVTALINGEKKIGVSAFRPDKGIDYGPVYTRVGINIKYPIKIKDAFLLLSKCYAKAAKEILRKFKTGKKLTHLAQNARAATYSIWRDELDYFIDWDWDASKIKRFVDAVGWPYLGAKSTYDSQEIFLDEVEICADLNFENRSTGKICRLDDGKPQIIFGKGILKIISAHDRNAKKMIFTKIRKRLGN